jgi:hypothetical protein
MVRIRARLLKGTTIKVTHLQEIRKIRLEFGIALAILAGTIRQRCRGKRGYSPFQETDGPIRNEIPASSACFRWYDTPPREQFLSKDPE